MEQQPDRRLLCFAIRLAVKLRMHDDAEGDADDRPLIPVRLEFRGEARRKCYKGAEVLATSAIISNE